MFTDIDFFNFFRYVLGTIVTVYATLVTIQWAAGWYKQLVQSDRYVVLLRTYLIVHGLRLRFKTFWGDVLISLLLCVVFCILWRAHSLLNEIDQTLKYANRTVKSLAR